MESVKRIGVIAATLVVLADVADADIISDWNRKMVSAGVRAKAGAMQGRNAAIVHVAMFDAVNAIERRYTPYRVQPTAASGTSREAAAAAAAHFLLTRLYPDQVRDLDMFYRASLAAIPDGEPKSQGIQLGEKVAAEIFEWRAKDGADAPNTYRPYTAAGTYVPTALPSGFSMANTMPFALKQGSQFRPGAPYALQSAQWAKDYNEVKTMGVARGSARSAEQSVIARFWELPDPDIYAIVQQLAAAKKLDVIETARLFALVAMTTADVRIAFYDAKYTYHFWRPVTAIRNGDIDDNDATERDPAWEPFRPTPMHPEYPCGHCVAAAAAAGVLEALFGDTVPTFTLTSPTAPGVRRSFIRLSDYVAEVTNARVYGGMHYRTSGEVGAAMGRKIGEYTVQHYLKPVRQPD
ncbi:PAP2 superfamily protein [Candidatus Methylomirabilis lanthanidiphila]|uniref:PAP2 superfamily protein n=1 Tax=Candidatus Methylomirabilis lanthanidiphila TaxID=2211376 RepID=A0A564ZJI6_9BACT|nr:vanadium-dependent haloperoxidase [Candidatus Methylomirabilis lanthanidiphila]VUZ85510.1 PAP2 superfamily protein [Candidatus Methylomirabilis lanthanidiphila]